MTIRGNTVVNARQAIRFENNSDCSDINPILDMDNNLIANQSSSNNPSGSTNGSGRNAVTISGYDGRNCSISAMSDFDNNHFYSTNLTDGSFDFGGSLGVDGNIAGAQDGASITAPNADGLVEGLGADAGIGAALSLLDLIQESEVGPGSTWTAIVSPSTAANVVGVVTVTGTAETGSVLTANVVDNNGLTGSVAYQWAASGVDIAGATLRTFTPGSAQIGNTITVTATYTDDAGNAESVVSAPTSAVVEASVNSAGSVAISQTSSLVGATFTATVTDANGTGVISYQWNAGGVDISGATSQTFVSTASQLGQILGVSVSYTDNDGFAEAATATATGRLFSAIVNGEASLATAITNASDGDWIGLSSASGGENYSNLAELTFAANSLTITTVAGASTPSTAITGSTCLVFSGNGIVVDGLTFDNLDIIQDSTCGGGTGGTGADSSILITGNNNVIRNSSILGEVDVRTGIGAGDPYHWIVLRGNNNRIERNQFSGKNTDLEGSAISIFANPSTASDRAHTIEYNLFKDFVGISGSTGSRDSGAHALQIGRTTGADSQGDGLHIVRYNRFDNIQTERRIMRVQSSGNTITVNTFINTLGNIALEDGSNNNVSRNIILSAGSDSDDGGISLVPFGHTVENNYIANLRTTSSDRGAILINADPLSGSGNSALIAAGGFMATVIRNNTIINARQSIVFEDDNECVDLNYTLTVDNNLIVTESSNTNGSASAEAISREDSYVEDTCSLNSASVVRNNHFYADRLTDSNGTTPNTLSSLFSADSSNLIGATDGASLTTPNADGLVEGSVVDAGHGVTLSVLDLIQESEVGPGSTWTFTVSTSN